MMLGNLTIEQIEKRMGIEFPEHVRDYMKKNHQPIAENIAHGKWHCFDIPFTLVCGDWGTAKMIYDSVKDKSKEVLEPLEFAVQDWNN